MSFKSDCHEFNTPIETSYWHLMEAALEKKLFLRLEKHIDSHNWKVISVKIFHTNNPGKCIFSEYDLCHSTELYFKAKKIIDETT